MFPTVPFGPLSLLFAATLALSACAPASTAPPQAAAPTATAAMVSEAPADAATPDTVMTDTVMTDTVMTDTVMTDTVMTDTVMTDTVMTDQATPADPAPTAPVRPAWHALSLIDARTGAPFTLADFAGKTVFVEPFATWCTNCRQQLANVHAARQRAAELGRDDVVFVALSVEPNIGRDALAAYAADTGYDLIFAAMPPELLQALAGEFGQTIANPPATPHFVLQPDGTAGPLVTGIESTTAILAQVGVTE